jgi:UDP-N-acetylmuramate dehydrogenase
MQRWMVMTMEDERLDALAQQLQGLGLTVTRDEPMSAHTTYQIGGPADLFVVAEDREELIGAVHVARSVGTVPFVLGGGANLLVSDAGIRGMVIHYRGARRQFTDEYGEVLLWIEAGAPLKEVSRESIARGVEGLEWAVDVPGTVGGAVVGNAGAYGGYVCDNLISVEVLQPDGKVEHLDNLACGFCYRGSKFKRQPRAERAIVLSATFALRPGDAEEIASRSGEYTKYRAQRHPSEPSCGSVFKRTEKYPAGFLIDQSGLTGTRRGNAVISPQHANYIINLGDATAGDVRALIDLARSEVKRQFGEDLELEVELVGEW